MSDRIRVDFDQLDELKAWLERSAESLEAIQDWFDAVVKWMRTQWSGLAELAFEAAQRMWDRAMDALREMLSLIARAVGEVCQIYRTTEKDCVSAW